MTYSKTMGPGTKTTRFDWRLFAVLTAMALVGAVAVVPYQLGIAPDAPEQAGLSLPEFVAVTILSGLAIAVLGAVVGLWLGPKVGLGAPLLSRLVRGRIDRGTWRKVAVLSATAGALLAGLLVAVDLALAPLLPEVEVGEVGLATRFAASIYGAVNEELFLRFGVLTALVWLVAKVRRSPVPSPGMMWVATVLAALAFAVLHLPALATVTELTPVVVGRTVGMNLMLGSLFGWLYWSRGLAAAIISHFAADLVIQTSAWLMA